MRQTGIILTLLFGCIVLCGGGCRGSQETQRIVRDDSRGPRDLGKFKIFDERVWSKEQKDGHQIATTIEWLDVSSQEGMTYLNGNIRINKITRFIASGLYSTTIRMRNKTDHPIECETKIAFFDIKGELISGFQDGWTPAYLDAFSFHKIVNSCKFRGAIGFHLFVRKQGTTDEGHPDFKTSIAGKATEEQTVNPTEKEK